MAKTSVEEYIYEIEKGRPHCERQDRHCPLHKEQSQPILDILCVESRR